MSHRSGGVASSGPCDEPNPKTILAIDNSLRRALAGAATPITVPQFAHLLISVADEQCIVADIGPLANDGIGKRDELRQLQRLVNRHRKSRGVLQDLPLAAHHPVDEQTRS